jgi:hypothetical protein
MRTPENQGVNERFALGHLVRIVCGGQSGADPLPRALVGRQYMVSDSLAKP